jgi:hypothetical protein
MRISKGDYFEIVPPAYSETVPRFDRMVIVGEAEGPELWWTSETCTACGVTTWSPTPDGVAAQMAVITGEEVTPRQVYASSWNGEDVFRLPDPGPPVVTQRFVDVLDRLAVKGVSLAPAEWV